MRPAVCGDGMRGGRFVRQKRVGNMTPASAALVEQVHMNVRTLGALQAIQSELYDDATCGPVWSINRIDAVFFSFTESPAAE